MPGSADLVLTGQLGDVMKESARIAWRSRSGRSAGVTLFRDASNEFVSQPSREDVMDG